MKDASIDQTLLGELISLTAFENTRGNLKCKASLLLPHGPEGHRFSSRRRFLFVCFFKRLYRLVSCQLFFVQVFYCCHI